MARIPRSFARRARSTASIFLGTPSGSECACISIAPLRVCAFADSEKTRNVAASCDLMDVPFIEQVSLELGVDLTRASHWLPRQWADYFTAQHGAMPRASVSTMATVKISMMARTCLRGLARRRLVVTVTRGNVATSATG